MDINRVSFDIVQTYFEDVTHEIFLFILHQFREQEGDLISAIFDVIEEEGCSSLAELYRKLKPIEKLGSGDTVNDDNVVVKRCPPGMQMYDIKCILEVYLACPQTKNILRELSEQNNNGRKKRLSNNNSGTAIGVLVLLRGTLGNEQSLPASTLWAINRRTTICSVKNFFRDPVSGENQFVKKNLKKAHKACQSQCSALMAIGQPIVVIDNTNARVIDMIPYVRLAVSFKYDVKIIDTTSLFLGDFDTTAKNSSKVEKISESELINRAMEKNEKKGNVKSVRKVKNEKDEIDLLFELCELFPFEKKGDLLEKLNANGNELDDTVLELVQAGKAMVTDENREAERVLGFHSECPAKEPEPGYSGSFY